MGDNSGIRRLIARALRIAIPIAVVAGATVAVSGGAPAGAAAGVPDAPTNVRAVPAAGRPAGNGMVTVSWTAPNDNGSDIDSSIVTYGADDTFGCMASQSGTSCSIDGLTGGIPIAIRVTATNEFGNGPASADVFATPLTKAPPTVPAAPTKVKAVPAQGRPAGNGMVTVSWTAPNDNGSPIDSSIVSYGADNTFGCMTSETGTSCSIDGLTGGIPIAIRVTATNEIGDGPASADVTATPLTAAQATAPAAPTLDAPVAGDGSITVSWTPKSDGGSPITGYTVSANSPAGNSTCVPEAISTSCTLTGLTNGQSYFIFVQATNAAGTSPPSKGHIVTPLAPPSASTTAAPTSSTPSSSVPSASVPSTSVPSSADRMFVPLTPSRVLDTRGGAKIGNANGTGTPMTLSLAGRSGLPNAGIGAVALNVTVVDGENPTNGGGYVTVYPCGTRPDASNLNFTAGQTIPNAVIAPVSTTGTVCFYVYGKAHLLADVSGYIPASSPFTSMVPTRVLDTRNGAKIGNANGTGTPVTLSLAGRSGLPNAGIGAVALNVTVVDGENPTNGGGYVTVYPCGTRPDASNLNFTAGQTIPNAVIAPVSTTGTVCFYVYGKAHLLADVSGYIPASSPFTSMVPTRVLDTRNGAKIGNANGTGTPVTLSLAGRSGLPNAGIDAVALNVTVVDGENPTNGGGYVTVYPCGTRPDASNLNFTAGQTIPNAVIAPVSTTGTVCFYVYGKAHLLADVSGYFHS